MNTTDPPEEEASHDERSDAWIDALQGHPPMPGVGAASRAGAMLRELVLQAQRDRAQEDAAYGQALIDRWASSGLLHGKPPRGAMAGRLTEPLLKWLRLAGSRRPGRARWLAVPAVALAGLTLGVWFTVTPPQAEWPAADEDASVIRGAESALQVTTDHPEALALRIEQVLRRRDIPLRRMDLPHGAVQLQARLTAPMQVVRQELLALGVVVPEHGRLNLVISKPR